MSVDSLKLNVNKLSFQELVFQRWINSNLLRKDLKITNLYDDLANGIHLVHLIESLTHHEFKSKIKTPSFRTQKMENITMVLNYLQENEQIKFLNIDSSNILNKESKLVLTYIWHLIEYFSISKSLELYFNLQNNINSGKSLKQKFLTWLKSKIYPLTIRNLSTDFKSGIIIGALVNYYDKTLCNNWKLWKETNAVENAKDAIENAAEKLGIFPIIEAEELANCKLDDKSIMTYLSQFILLECEPVKGYEEEYVTINGLGINTNLNIDRVTYPVNQPVDFTIESKISKEFIVTIINPNGESGFVNIVDMAINPNGSYFLYKFTPLTIGQHQVSVMSSKLRHIIKLLQFMVVEENNLKMFHSKVFQNNNSVDDKYDLEIPDSILLYRGRGIQPTGIRIGDISEFTVTVSDIDKWNILNLITIVVRTPENQNLEVKTVKYDNSVKCQYVPDMSGLHKIIIKIKNYAYYHFFKINVSDSYLFQILAFGPGLKHAFTNDPAVFVVETNGETGLLNFTIEGPDEARIQCKDNGDGSATVIYWPISIGEYAIHILCDDQDIKNSPFMIDVEKRDNEFISSKVKVYGPALNESILIMGHLATFTIDMAESRGTLDKLIVKCYDRFGTAILINIMNENSNKRTYSFIPSTTVKLCLLVTYDGLCVSDSPYMIYVVNNSLSDNIKVRGSGLESAYCGKESLFFIDCELISGKEKLEVMVTDSNLNQIPCTVECNLNEQNVYNVRYIPPYNVTRCLIEILFNKISVYKEPIIVPILANESNIFKFNPSEVPNQISNPNNVENQIDETKPGDVFKGFSDIFLDPNTVSLLKLIVPPRTSTDSNMNSVPSSPLYSTEDNNDCFVANSPMRFQLSTVFEESEENGSIQDSILSSGTHSRASIKEEIVSLSRRSSFTLAPSPNLNGVQSHTKLESNSNMSSYCNFANYDINVLSSLPPKPSQLEIDILKFNNLNAPEFDENYYDDLPLPEPPPDCELLISNSTNFLNFSQNANFNFNIEQIHSTPVYCQMLPNSCYKFRVFDLLVETINSYANMYLCQSIRNSVSFSNSCHNLVDICVNKDFSQKFNNNFDNIYIDNKMDDIDNLVSDALPVNLMGAILSPFDDEDSCLSDISYDALPFEKPILDREFSRKLNFIYPTENYMFVYENQSESLSVIKLLQPITIKDIATVEPKNQFSRIIKEITTSEISEISDTSQWLSVEDKINNQFNGEHIDDQSFINSFSEIPKSSSSNIIQAIHIMNGQEIGMGNNFKINQHNLTFQNNFQPELIELKSLPYEMVINLLQESKYNELDENSGQIKLLSWESDNCTESLGSNSFPEPPTETVESPYEINLCNSRSDILSEYLSQDANKNKLLSKLKDPSLKFINRNNDQEMLQINPKANNKRIGAQLKYCESGKKLVRLTNIKTTFTFRSNCSTITSYKTPHSSYYSNNNKWQNKDLEYIDSSHKWNPSLQSNSLDLNKKSVSTIEMAQCKDVLDLNFNECSKSSNLLTENIFNDFSRPKKISHRNNQRKRRSFSQSHVYNCQSMQTPQLSKQNSLECLNRSSGRFNNDQSTKSTENQLNKKEYLKTLNFEPLRNDKTVSSYGDEITLKSNVLNYQNSSKNHVIRDKTVTNVDGDYKSCFTSDLKPERDDGHYNDCDYAEKDSRIYVQGDGLFKAFVNTPAEILIVTNGQGTEGLSLTIEGPSKTEIETTNLADGNCKIVYIPQSPGDYVLAIQQYDEHINGSPFRISVKSNDIDKSIVTTISTSKKAYAEGQGLTDAIIDFPNQFNIYTKEAGPGGLSLSIEGPSKAIIEFKDAKNGVCGVTYRVTEPGLYTCIVKFNRKHIMGSPFGIDVNPKQVIGNRSNEIPTKLEPYRQMYQIAKKSIFKTTLNKINLDPKIAWFALLHSPSGGKKEVYINYDYKNDIIWAEFVPNEIGIHWLSFMYESDKHLPINFDTSFQIIVEEVNNFDLTKFHRELESIKVFGKGLVRGKAGTPNSFQIEIGESVSGALNVTVDGPSKVEIKCNETEKGFRFSYIPAIQGDYLVTIKYGGEYQIKGSPFQVKILTVNKLQNKVTVSKKRISSSPMSQSSNNEFSTITNPIDLSSILCYGSGLTKAHLYTWMDFYIDASKNKINHLLVGIIGPNEPCEEIRILYIENNRYLVSYKPKEKGKHVIIIKWGDSHLCCSPVEIDVE